MLQVGVKGGSQMNTATARITTNARIDVKGEVTLGRRCELVQAPTRPGRSRLVFTVGVPDDGSVPSIDAPPLPAPPGQLPVERLGYSLVADDRDWRIADDGLTASYGIFGAPRSGKSYLLMHLLGQLFSLWPDKPEQRFGGLILDPKAALTGDVRELMHQAGRDEDLVVLNISELAKRDELVNVLDCALDPTELGKILVLAAQSAGTAASEPFWFGAWSNLFSAALPLLDWTAEEDLNLQLLLDTVLFADSVGPDGRPERRIQRIARDARQGLAGEPVERRRDLLLAVNQLEAFYRQEPENVATVESLITRAYGGFQQSRWNRLSPHRIREPGTARPRFYDEIIDAGKVVLVSVSPSEPAMAKTICTLVKCLFQQTVLSRLARVREGSLRNFTRPVVLAVDEYSDVASEVPGEPMGDGYFFSLARQNGCMGLVATQSVNMLQASSLKENWKAVFSTFGAKIFMRLADNETAEEAQKQAGNSDWYLGSAGQSQQKDGLSMSRNTELRERKTLPTEVLTQVLKSGEAVIVGSLDGSVTKPSTMFLRVPDRGR
jgi:hypothetical protein